MLRTMGYCRNCRLYKETFQRGCENPRGSSSESTERATGPLLFLSPSPHLFLLSHTLPAHTSLQMGILCVRNPKILKFSALPGFYLRSTSSRGESEHNFLPLHLGTPLPTGFPDRIRITGSAKPSYEVFLL